VSIDLSRELAFATSLAEEAAVAVMAARGTAKVTKKAGGEPVTAADLEANRIILAGLVREFPADAILSEETPSDSSRLRSSRVWIIDPIDGTREFIEGTDDFAVQIGLAVEGEPVLGVVFQCARRRLFLAAKGTGAWVEDPSVPGRARRALVPSAVTDPREMMLTVSRWHHSKKHDILAAALAPRGTLPAGSIGVKMGLVALSKADVYLHPSSKVAEWDSCGPDAILREAGGAVTDLFGAPLLYNQPDPHHPRGLAASNGRAHAAILARVSPVARSFFSPP
jgi:3'(2'), 5'-bisphosphate nucleotidase